MISYRRCAWMLAACLLATLPVRAEWKVTGGEAGFSVKTNLGFTVEGHTAELTGTGSIKGRRIQSVQARIPAFSIETGLSLRDRHLRERILSTEEGDVRDLTFEASDTECRRLGKELSCRLRGRLSIGGRSRKQSFQTRIFLDGIHGRVEGEGSIALSDYGIERPSRLGATVNDRIKIRFSLEVRRDEKKR